MKHVKKGRYMTAADLSGLVLQAEAIRVNVRQARGEIKVHDDDPLEVLLKVAGLIEDAATQHQR